MISVARVASHPESPIISPSANRSGSLLAQKILMTCICACSSHPINTYTNAIESKPLLALKYSIVIIRRINLTIRWMTASNKIERFIDYFWMSTNRVEFWYDTSRVLLNRYMLGMRSKFLMFGCFLPSSKYWYSRWASPSQVGQALLMLQLRKILTIIFRWQPSSSQRSSSMF